MGTSEGDSKILSLESSATQPPSVTKNRIAPIRDPRWTQPSPPLTPSRRPSLRRAIQAPSRTTSSIAKIAMNSASMILSVPSAFRPSTRWKTDTALNKSVAHESTRPSDLAVRQRADAGLAERIHESQRARRAAAALIPARDPRGIALSRVNRFFGGRRIREIAVEKLVEDLRADFLDRARGPGAVKRHVEPDAAARNQVKVAVERVRVAAVADD